MNQVKLSKAQQAIVDKMREGYTLFYHGGGLWTYRKLLGNTTIAAIGITRVVNCLAKQKILEETHGLYRLTEQYKTQPCSGQEGIHNA